MSVFLCFQFVYYVNNLDFLSYILSLKDTQGFRFEANQLKHKKIVIKRYREFYFTKGCFSLAIIFDFGITNENFLKLISHYSFLLLLSYEFQIMSLNDHQHQNFKMLKVILMAMNIDLTNPFLKFVIKLIYKNF